MLTKIFGKELYRALLLLKPKHWRYFTGIVMTAVISTMLTVGRSYAVKVISNAIVSQDPAGFQRGMLQFIVLVLVMVGVFPFFAWMYNKNAKLTGAKMVTLFFENLIHLPVKYFDAHHTGDIVSRMNNDTMAMEGIYGGYLRRMITPFISAIIIAVTMLIYHWKIGTLLILLNLLYVFLNSCYAVPIRTVSEKILADMSKATQKALDFIAGNTTIKVFQLDRMMLERYAATNRELTSHLIKRLTLEGCLEGTNYLLNMVNSIGITTVGFFMAIRYGLDIGSILALMSIQSGLTQALLGLSKNIPIVQESLVGARRVFEFLDEPAEPDYPTKARETKTITSIELKDIHFTYPEEEEPVCQGLNLTIRAGEIIAIIGPSGSGKSTILKLLLSFYRPQSGQILINGEPMSHYSLKDLRGLMAYVPQEPFLFQGTIEENIRYGKPDATHEELVRAATAAYAHEFIDELPEKYQTDISERGASLSGGQKQRIAIARAILKDAPLLLLDEATSALDTRSEYYVQKALQQLMKGRTTIIVAHRLSTIRDAHRVFRMEGGKLIPVEQLTVETVDSSKVMPLGSGINLNFSRGKG